MKTSLSKPIEVRVHKNASSRAKADLLVIPYFMKEKASPVQASASVELTEEQLRPLNLGDFNGSANQILCLYQEGQKEPRILLLGLGAVSSITTERLRRAYSAVLKWCQEHKLNTANLLLPKLESLPTSESVRGVIEGILLTNYTFHHNLPNDKQPTLSTVRLIGDATSRQVQEAVGVCQGILYARDLINENADQLTPPELAKASLSLAKSYPKLKATIFDEKRIKKEGLSLLEAVGRGAVHPPRFILLRYQGNPRSKDHTVLVGKGITYDTGGLNLKNPTGMEHQRSDMGGAGAVLGAMRALAELQLPVNVTAVIPSAENAIDANSYKQGDVYPSYSGKTVEIGNTDAEGRLILADALSYAVRNLKPSRVIDFATLTGAIVIALGDAAAGLFTNDDALAEELSAAGKTSEDQVWRLPLIEEYTSKLSSDRADLCNVGDRGGASITAALFLQAFVEETPWAHLDIAGVRFRKEAKHYHPKGATGFGVRLVIDFLRRLAK